MDINVQLALKVAKLKGLEMWVRGLATRETVVSYGDGTQFPRVSRKDIVDIAQQINDINLELAELIDGDDA